MKLENRGLGFQVTVLMLFIALAAGVVGTIGIYGMYQMNDTSNMVYEQDVVPLNQLSEMRFDAQVYRSDVALAVSARTPEERQKFLTDINEKSKDIEEHMGQYEAISESAQESDLGNSLKPPGMIMWRHLKLPFKPQKKVGWTMLKPICMRSRELNIS